MFRTCLTVCVILMAAPLWAAGPTGGAPETQPAAKAPAASTQPAAAAAPATQPAGGAKATAVVVTGQAQKSVPADGTATKWEPLRQGDELGERTIIRTGLDSGVLLNLAGRGEVRIGSATKIGISELKIEGSLAKTQLGLKYGTIRAEVDSRTGPADFRVATPTATLSIRGSALEAAVTNENGTQGYSLHGLLTLNQPGSPPQTGQPGDFVLGNGQMSTPYLFFLYTEIPGDPGGMNRWELITFLENNHGKGSGPESITTSSGIQLNTTAQPPGNTRTPGSP